MVNGYANALAVSFIQIITFLVGLLIWIFGFYAFAQYYPTGLETLRFGNIFILGYLVIIVLLVGIIIWIVYFFRIIYIFFDDDDVLFLWVKSDELLIFNHQRDD